MKQNIYAIRCTIVKNIKRKETIERIFADAKEKHGMRYTKYRGLEKSGAYNACFVAMNLKKLATWQWEHMSLYLLLYKNRQKYQSTLLVKRKLMLLSTVLESGTIVFLLYVFSSPCIFLIFLI